MGAEKLSGQADVNGAPPILGPYLLNPSCWSRDAGVVDKDIEPSERRLDLGEEARNVGFRRDVRLG